MIRPLNCHLIELPNKDKLLRQKQLSDNQIQTPN